MSSQSQQTTARPTAPQTTTKADRWDFTWRDWFWRSLGRRTVLVRASGSGAASKTTYHTDYDCPRGGSATKLIPKPLSVLHDDIRHCKYCSGDVEPNKPGKQTHLNALKERARELNGDG